MALEIKRGEKPVGALLSDRRLYLTADKETVVEDGDPRAAYLFATEGYELSAGIVEQYGLVSVEGRVVLPGAPKPEAEPEAKATEEPDGDGAAEESSEQPNAEPSADPEPATEAAGDDPAPAPRRSKRGRSGGS